MGMIKENIDAINRHKDEITVTAGRKPGEVLLVAVTKTRSAEEINEAIDAGITDIGENKVQEIMDKYEAVKPVRWHMIGHLQTNKVKYICGSGVIKYDNQTPHNFLNQFFDGEIEKSLPKNLFLSTPLVIA